MKEQKTASIIFAAGCGSRMKNYQGNKTLLPLIPGEDPYKGENLVISEVIRNLPQGPKAVVVNHRKDEVIAATLDSDIFHYEQPVANGTGGALIAAREFLEKADQEHCIITMGDVPFVKGKTYRKLVEGLREKHIVVLGFEPMDKAQYGILDIIDGEVKSIIEWRYWREYPLERQKQLKICNSGIYAVERSVLIRYLLKLKDRPHFVEKARDGQMMVVEEYFITDLIKLMNDDGLSVGFHMAEKEKEVMGIDTQEDLILAQAIFEEMNKKD